MTTPYPESESLKKPSGITAVLAILLTFALGGSVLALLFYRGLTQKTPDRVIVVRGNSDWDGAELSLDGGTLKEPQETTIMPAGGYIVPFFVWPGTYTLHVKSQGIEVYQHEFNVTTQPSEEIDLATTGATTRPATMPSTMPGDPAPSGAGALGV